MVADACEWIRQNGTHRPLVFVVTSPGYTNRADECRLISKFVHNLKNGYGCNHYVWVREETTAGYPHYHFVCDMPRIKSPVDLSKYWSGLFGRSDSNSIRLGTKPGKDGRRTFHLTGRRMAQYMGKYIGADIGKSTSVKRVRGFAISQQCRLMSQPITFEANYHYSTETDQAMKADESYETRPARCIGRTFEADDGQYFNPHHYHWFALALHPVYFGNLKEGMLREVDHSTRKIRARSARSVARQGILPLSKDRCTLVV